MTDLGGGVGEDGGRDRDGDVVHVERSEEILRAETRSEGEVSDRVTQLGRVREFKYRMVG